MLIQMMIMDTQKQSQPTNIDQEVSEIFQVDPELIVEPEKPSEQALIPINAVGKMPAERAETDDVVEDDVDLARDSLKNVINVGNNAANALEKLALTTEHPRAFEALATLLSQITQASKDIVELHKIKKQAKRDDAPSGPMKIDKAIFVGSTSDLQKAMKEIRDGQVLPE